MDIAAHYERAGESQSEFRRRTRTQASFSTEASPLTVLVGFVAVGQIVFRKIDGHHELAAFLVKDQWSQAA